jgi:hypothetical protein
MLVQLDIHVGGQLLITSVISSLLEHSITPSSCKAASSSSVTAATRGSRFDAFLEAPLQTWEPSTVTRRADEHLINAPRVTCMCPSEFRDCMGGLADLCDIVAYPSRTAS